MVAITTNWARSANTATLTYAHSPAGIVGYRNSSYANSVKELDSRESRDDWPGDSKDDCTTDDVS